MKKILRLLLIVLDEIALIRYPKHQLHTEQKATIKFSAFVTDLKGKIGGTVFQGSKVGGTVKNKPNGNYVKRIPWVFGKSYTAASWEVDMATASELTAGQVAPDGSNIAYNTNRSTQQIIRGLSKTWGALTSDQRNAWNAAAVNFPFKNKYGDIYIGSGYQVFQSINAKLLPLGVTLQTLPPSASDGDLATWTWDTISFSSDSVDDEFMQLNVPDGIAEGAAVTVTMFPPMSAGKLKTVFGGKGQINMRIQDPGTYQLLPLYYILFGTPLIGANINALVEVVNLSNGHILYSNNFSAIVEQVPRRRKLKTVFGGKGQIGMRLSPVPALHFISTSTTYDLGEVSVDHDSDMFYYILQALQLDPKETVNLVVGGAHPENFVIYVGSYYNPPISATTIKANSSGYIPAQPIWVQFQPDSAMFFSCTLSISSTTIDPPIVITFTGTGI